MQLCAVILLLFLILLVLPLRQARLTAATGFSRHDMMSNVE